MSKKRKIDFVLRESDTSKLIFRFYPRQSSCHSFGDEPPKDWSDVYKVYYSYSIIRVYKEDNWYKTLFNCRCDECSIIDEIAERCKLLAEGKTVFKGEHNGEEYTIKLLNNEVHPFGMGTSWMISRRNNIYEFRLFDWDDIGYRFCLKKDKLKAFGEYLSECCEYMLAHGDPI